MSSPFLRGPAGLPRRFFDNAIRLPAAISARLGPLGKGGVWLVLRLKPQLSDARGSAMPFVPRERGLSFLDALRVLDTARVDPRVQGVRKLNDLLANERRVDATGIQTVGSKGYDGFILARVVG